MHLCRHVEADGCQRLFESFDTYSLCRLSYVRHRCAFHLGRVGDMERLHDHWRLVDAE